MSSVAPCYTLTASIGLIVASVGLKMPAIFIAGFIPMFLTAYAYRELNTVSPDAGASFTWSTKAFGPYVGWMCGWGMVISTIIVLSNLAFIAVDFLYLFIGQIASNPAIAELPHNKAVNIFTTLAFIAVATLYDTIAALGIMICWYYGITAFACAWYFRHEVFNSVKDFVLKLAFPVLGGIMLAIIFIISAVESLSPSYGTGTMIGGVGLVFILAFGILALGVVLMFIMRAAHPTFFRGQTLTRGTPVLVEE